MNERLIIPSPPMKAPPIITRLGPYLSSKNPSIGASTLPSSLCRENAPEIAVLLHPKVLIIGLKNT